MEKEVVPTSRQYPKLISEDRLPVFQIGKVAEARAEPPVRGEKVLRFLEKGFVALASATERVLPASLNPFTQMGAVANTTFLIALVTGILLLFWYSPSVNHAYASVEAMQASPYLAQLLRSLHRYSSDACMLFVLLHGFQIFFARKIGGARWLAWVSGIVLIGLLWFDGWTGYWLVWDERARQVALGTAQLIDVLPLFPDPLARSFLTNEGVNSLFFFLIFFIHMLIPMAMGVFLWVHIMRLNKSKFLTGNLLSGLIVVTLILVSLIVPATSAGAAEMGKVPQDLTIDWYYLFPLFFTDRLTGGVLWGMVFVGTILTFGLPWLLIRRRPEPAIVDEQRCNGCTQCHQDCPYNAITLMPRQDGKEGAVVARIDPAKCVGCGICVGSCDSTSISQSRLPVLDVRRWINHQADEPGEEHAVAFVCAESAGAGLRIDGQGTSPDLPGYRIVPVPCAGWVHMLTVERALRHGASGVLIVGCGDDPVCRHGAIWTADRLEGRREPALRHDKVDAEKVRYLRYDRTAKAAFLAAAETFRTGKPISDRPAIYRQIVSYGGVAVLVLALLGLTLFLSDTTYLAVPMPQAELVISFKHAGQAVAAAQEESSQDNRLPHMRGTTTARQVRVPVRMVVLVDGKEVIRQAYEPGGLFHDGSSVAIEPVSLEAGTHHVEIRIGDTEDPEEWSYRAEQTLTFKAATRQVVLFEKTSGFTWY